MKILNFKLAPKILILLTSVVFGLMSVYGFFQIKQIEKTLIQDAEKNHTLYLSNSLTVFEKALWDYDRDVATTGMLPLFQVGTVGSIRLFDTKGVLFSGLKSLQNKDGSSVLVPIIQANSDFSNLNINEIVLNKLSYSDSLSKRVLPMQNFPQQKHRLISTLWKKLKPPMGPKLLGFAVIDFSTEYIDAQIREQRLGFIFLTIVLSLSILILTLVFLHFQVVVPLNKLMQASLDVAAGKYTKLKILRRQDEISSLTENFNLMSTKIENNLTLIRGLSEASQVIVQCKEIKEIASSYEYYGKKLVNYDKLEIWVNPLDVSEFSSYELFNAFDDKKISSSEPCFQRLLLTKEFFISNEKRESNYIHTLIFPLLNANNNILGMIKIFYNKSNSKYGEEEVRIIKSLNVSLATAIDNLWHVLKEKERANIERDIEMASAVEDAIISKNIPNSDVFEISTFYKSSSKCGGNWYGIYEINKGKILVLFGEVFGYGTSSALITAVTRGASDMLMQVLNKSICHIESELPVKFLELMNECIFATGKQAYLMGMSAAYFDFDLQKVYLSSAGHSAPVLFTTNVDHKIQAKFLSLSSGVKLGEKQNVKFEMNEIDFNVNEKILFYTNSIIEGKNKSFSEYGSKRFKNSVETHTSKDSKDFLQSVVNDAFNFFEGASQKDDVALLYLRFLNKPDMV